jgi:opacity protein-like surface antigen
MKRFTCVTLAFSAIACAASAVPANAQDGAAAPGLRSTAPRVEVTPFFSIDSRGSSPIGAGISFPLGANFRVEAETAYRRGEGHVSAPSSSANLLYELPRLGRVTPYLATGAGLALYGAPIVSPESFLLGTASRVAFEINAGGGVKVPAGQTMQMRTDARWFKSFGKDASEHWRVSQGLSFDVGQR